MVPHSRKWEAAFKEEGFYSLQIHSLRLFNMRLYTALILLVTLSTAHALNCYTCTVDDPTPCDKNTTCAEPLDMCYSFSAAVKGENRGCHRQGACKSPFYCCSEDLCNSAVPPGSSVLLLLLSSAVISLCL